MEPECGGKIKIKITMMNLVKSPENRNLMKYYILLVDNQIKDDNRQENLEKYMYLKCIKNTQSLFHSIRCYEHWGKWEDSNNQSIKEGKTKVYSPSLFLVIYILSLRKKDL